jgi:predicted ester cyclase
MVRLPHRLDDQVMTSHGTAHNKQLVETFIQELFSKCDLDAVDRYLDPAFVNHDAPFPGAPDGPAGMRLAATVFRQALPDWHSEVDQLVAEGDLVVERFTASGTHRGELMGAQPTGKTITLAGINIFRIDGDKIVERWGRLDELGILRQLGLVPY